MSWFSRLRRRVARGVHRSPEPPQDPAVERIRRILPDANPFGVELWECADFTQSRIAMTENPEIAMRFGRLRVSDGREYRNRLPPGASIASCSLEYPARDLSEGVVFRAEGMEDKWDVYHYPPHLYFVRSWTGALEYRVDVHATKTALRVTRIASAQNHDPEFSRRVVDYLIKSHVFGVVTPHPLPPDVPDDPLEVASWSFAVFGRRCALATRADTTALPWTGESGRSTDR